MPAKVPPEPKIVPPAKRPSKTPDPAGADPWADLNGKEKQQILDHREKFAAHAYGITNTWVGFLIVLTIAQFSLKPLGLQLGRYEFIAVFTTTTGAVLGFGMLVGRFLFSNNMK